MAPLLRKQSDDKAFERLYERHVKDVFRYSLAVLGARADAEDVTQTTFLNAYRAFQRGERPEKPENWLIAIAHNVCRQRFRQQQRRPSEVEFDDELGGTVEADDGAPSVEELRRAFAALPPNQRAALVMRELEGRRYDEIAEVLGITVSALETLLFRARRSLREQLEEQLTCREAAFAVSKQMDGRLSAGERKALRAHLRACPECARLASSERAQRKALRTLLAVPLPQSLQAFWPHAAETAAGGAAAGGTALAVKAAAVVAAGSLVGGGAYEGVRHVPPLLDGPKPAAARRASAAPAVARPAAHASAPARTVHVVATRVAPTVQAPRPHRPKPAAHVRQPGERAKPHGDAPAAVSQASDRGIAHSAAARDAANGEGKRQKRGRHEQPAAPREHAVKAHGTSHPERTTQHPPAVSAHAVGRGRGKSAPARNGNGHGGRNAHARGSGNGGAHGNASAHRNGGADGHRGASATQPPASDAPAPSVTVTVPQLPSVPPPIDLPGNGNGNGNGNGDGAVQAPSTPGGDS